MWHTYPVDEQSTERFRGATKSGRLPRTGEPHKVTRNFSKKGSKYEKRSPPKCARTLNLTEIGLCFAPARLKPWRVSARWRFSPTRSRLMRILPSPAFPVHTGGRGFVLILAQIFLCGNSPIGDSSPVVESPSRS